MKSGFATVSRLASKIRLQRCARSTAGDDTLLLTDGEAGIALHPFRRQFGLDSEASVFSELEQVDWERQPADRNKYAVDVDILYPGSVVSSFQPHVILFPEIGHTGTSELDDVKPSEALRELLIQSSFVMLEPALPQGQLQALRNPVTSTWHFRLVAGRDVFQDPLAFARLVESAVGG